MFHKKGLWNIITVLAMLSLALAALPGQVVHAAAIYYVRSHRGRREYNPRLIRKLALADP